MADYTLSARITGDASGFTRAVSDARARMQGLSDSVTQTGEKIGKFGAKTAATGAVMTAGITLPFMNAISMTADFDSAMRKAGAIAGANATELDKMTAAALDLGATTSLSGSEVANAMAEMAAKGFDANATISAMPGVIAAAEASGEDLALTADVVASAITGFGLAAGDSGRVADVLAMAANATAAGVGDMGYAFKYAAPVANNLGISMEELAAATGIMTNAGLDGSQAGTTLRMALGRLVKPTSAGATALENLGVSAIDADGNFKPLNQIIGDLQTGMEDMTAAQQQAALSTIFGTEAASGMAIVLAQGQEGLQKLTKELENSEGASAAAAAQMKAGIGGALENLSGAVESATISLMSQLTPTIAALATKMSELIDKFNGVSEGTKKIIAFGVLGLAALGPLLTLIGLMTMGFGGLVMAIGFLVSPIGLVIIGVAALVAAFATAMLRSEEFRNSVMEVFERVKEVVSGAVETLKPILANMWAGASENAASFADGLGAKFTAAFATVKSAFDLISTAVSVFVAFVSPALTTLWTTVSTAIGQFVGFVVPVLQTVWDSITAGAASMSEGFGAKVLTVFETVRTVVMTVVGVIGQFVMSIVDGFSSAGGSVSSLGALFMIFSPLLKIAMMILTQFGPQIAAGFMEIASLVVPILTTLGTMLGQLAAAVIPLVMNVIATLIPIIVTLAMAIFEIVSAVLPVLLNLFMQLVPVVMSLVQTVIGLVTSLLPLVSTIIGAVVPVIMMLVDVILNIVQAVAPALIAIIGAIIAIFQAVIPVVVSILTVVIHVFAMIIATLTPIIAFVAGLITSIIAIIAPIVTFIAGVIASIFKVITPIIAFVNGVFQTVFTIISDVWQTIMQYIASAISSISNTIAQVSGVVSGVFNGIWSKISSVMDRVRTKIQGVFDAIKNSWSGLKLFVSSVFTGIGDNMADLVSRVKGFVNGVIGGINSAIGLINKIPGVEIGKIPYLARGTDDWAGGFARMNEGGRGELVNLPNGAQVIPHDVSMKYAREAGQANARGFSNSDRTSVINEGAVNIHIAKFENHTDRDLETLSHDLGWMTQRERSRLSND